MPFYKGNKAILDRKKPLELVLELLSFSGGENTKGEDQELKANEARIIENWDAIAIGGMKRSKGFNLEADGANVIEAAVFTGAGLDDATSGGVYTGTSTVIFEVEIDAEGDPDTFKWKKGAGAYTTGIVITGAAQTLSDGVTITFAAVTGHTLADKWNITAVCYTEDIDLVIQHDESGSSRTYAVIEGDLVYENGAVLTQADANAFTSGLLCHGVSVGDVLYTTNTTDNIKKKTIGNAIAALTNPPAEARERLYYHKFRLIA